jgi:hypothetical protein
MARYIDADVEVSKYVTVWDCDCSDFGEQTVMAVDDLHYLPTADVAPRAEVDELIHKLECLLCHATGSKLSYHTYTLSTMESAVTDYIQECYDEAYDEARAEVAREIFEEIASKQITIVDHVGTMGVVVLLKDIFELKNKYTGESK